MNNSGMGFFFFKSACVYVYVCVSCTFEMLACEQDLYFGRVM